MFNSCKHDWKMLSEVTTKSGVDCIHKWKVLKIFTTMSRFEEANKICETTLADAARSDGAKLLERKHIQVFTCTKCGALKRFVEII